MVHLGNAGAPAQPRAVLPELHFKRLLNDLGITAAATPYLGESMTIGLVLRYGAAFDPAEKGGLAHLLSRMFLRSTADKTAQDIRQELDSLGARIEVHADWDGFRFLLHGQSSRFDRSLLILYQVVCEAKFNPEDFAEVRTEILDQLRKPQDPRQEIRGQLEKVLYRGTTYGRPLEGTPASLEKMTLGDIRLFYHRFFSPDSASLVVISSAPPDQVLMKATRIWGIWVRKDEIPFSFVPPIKPAGRVIYLQDDPSSPSAQFILGNLWPRREERPYYAATLAARILQERLTEALPTSLLTVHTEGRRMPGPIFIQGQAAAEQAGGEIQKILEVVESFKEAEVTPEELEAVQSGWIKDFSAKLGAVEGICDIIMDSELYRLGTNYGAALPDYVRRNGPGEVEQAAKDWLFPGGAVIVVRGPSALLKPALAQFGTVQDLER
jgi:zinc protease